MTEKDSYTELEVEGVTRATELYLHAFSKHHEIVAELENDDRRSILRDRLLARALGRTEYRDSRSSAILTRMLKSGDLSTRVAAARALANSGRADAADALIEALADSSATVRGWAATALGALQSTQAIEPLGITLEDNDRNVRYRAALALGAIGGNKAAQLLRSALPVLNFVDRLYVRRISRRMAKKATQ